MLNLNIRIECFFITPVYKLCLPLLKKINSISKLDSKIQIKATKLLNFLIKKS